MACRRRSPSPAARLRDLIQQRIAAGTFTGDPDKYIADTLHEVAQGKPINKILEMNDGRVIALGQSAVARRRLGRHP